MHICSFIYDEEPKRIHSTDALVRCEDPFTFLRKQTYPNSVCLFTGPLSLTQLIISILQQAFWLISPAIGGSWNLSVLEIY